MTDEKKIEEMKSTEHDFMLIMIDVLKTASLIKQIFCQNEATLKTLELDISQDKMSKHQNTFKEKLKDLIKTAKRDCAKEILDSFNNYPLINDSLYRSRCPEIADISATREYQRGYSIASERIIQGIKIWQEDLRQKYLGDEKKVNLFTHEGIENELIDTGGEG